MKIYYYLQGMQRYSILLVLIVLLCHMIGYGQKFEKSFEAKKINKANFHHIHLNAIDKDATIAYYQKFFGATQVKYRNRSNALFTEKSFILLDLVATAPSTHLGSSLWHIGWSGVDGESEYAWRVKEGIKVQTPITPLDNNHWMYFWGPNKEVIEVYTGNKNHRFEHIHLLASDVDSTMNWFKTHLGLIPMNEKAQLWGNNGFKWNQLLVDNINIIVFGKPVAEEFFWPKEGFKPTDNTAIDHIGFSFEKIDSIFEQMKSAGVDIVQDIKIDPVHGLKSFFVRGPDYLLVEIVEEKPILNGIWD